MLRGGRGLLARRSLAQSEHDVSRLLAGLDVAGRLDDLVETGQKTGNVVLRVSEAAPGEQPEPAAKHEEEVPT